ncbi:MAG: hypothetical protein AB7S97_06380 [Thermoplasmata archaeon]
MCRYSYSSGACANRHVESLKCVGEESCKHAQTNMLMKKGSTSPSSECGLDRWLDLYCEEHGRFFCPGKESGAALDPRMGRFDTVPESLAKRPREG